MSTFSFSLSSTPSASLFGPRLGNVIFKNRQAASPIAIETPGMITTTSRGVVPHLSRDHVHQTKAIKWIHLPFESFLEVNPPILTSHPGKNALQSFLGYSSSHHLISMSIRDPDDSTEMPPNGKDFICARCTRGVRRVTPANWKSYIADCQPDIAVAISDTLLSTPPYSQKRVIKSIERSCSWLLDLLSPQQTAPSNVFIPMAGGTSIPARKAFATTLLETLYGREAELVKPLTCLDNAVSGYIFDLVPLRLDVTSQAQARATSADSTPDESVPDYPSAIQDLMEASLAPLPANKVRIANSAASPHEILRLIQRVGVDMFDAKWAQRAANIGVALDFCFPAPSPPENTNPKRSHDTRHDLGHNLYDEKYSREFSSLAADKCSCLACSPLPPGSHLMHSSVDNLSYGPSERHEQTAFTKAYLHHLLHTHEMSAHSLLAMHNLTVLDDFFTGVRQAIQQGEERFGQAVEAFCLYYDEDLRVFEAARKAWLEVDRARGKGRLAREEVKGADA